MNRTSTYLGKSIVSLLFVAFFSCGGAWANGLEITNVTRGTLGTAAAANVTFTISWQNSWNVTGLPTNHDAAWVFVKYRPCGNSDNWHHALLSTTMANHTLSSGLAFARNITTTDRMGAGTTHNTGAMVRRANVGTGHIVNETITLNVVSGLGVSGAVTFDINTEYDIRVFGIEMVQVKEGNYYLGDPTYANTTGYAFGQSYNNGPMVTVSNEFAVLNLATPENQVCCWTYPTKAMPANYPKGWAEFYVMKYEISQGQYADFLNTLSTNSQTQRRLSNYGTNRNVLSNAPNGTTGRYTADEPNRACNFLRWDDLMGYLDWAALRPMTELEYEKACKGGVGAPYIDGSFAWGTTGISNLIEVRSPENGADTAITVAAFFGGMPPNVLTSLTTVAPMNTWCCPAAPYNVGCTCGPHMFVRSGAGVLSDGGAGPVGCGIFARDNTLSRVQTGATYWGVMEMSGNVNEMVVTTFAYASNAAANSISPYTGVWGNGVVNNTTGAADNADWPLTLFTGRCSNSVRGGNWNDTYDYCRIAYRWNCANDNGNTSNRDNRNGGRGVR